MSNPPADDHRPGTEAGTNTGTAHHPASDERPANAAPPPRPISLRARLHAFTRHLLYRGARRLITILWTIEEFAAELSGDLERALPRLKRRSIDAGNEERD